MRGRTLSAVLALAGACAPTDALAKLGNARESSVVALTYATGNLKIEAKTAELHVDEDSNGVVTVRVPLAGLDTGIALRNRHLREKYLHTDKYPDAELSVARNALAFPAEGQTATRSVPGTMRLHGTNKPVTFTYSARRAGAVYRVHGTVRVNINDFGVETPQFLGIKVNPNVDVTVDFVVNDP